MSRYARMIEFGVWLVMPVAFWALADEASVLGFIDAWRWMNPLSHGVIVVLAVLLVRTLSLSGDCLARFGKARRQSRSFVRKSDGLSGPDPEQIIALARRHPESHIAKIVVSGLTGVSQLPPWSSRDVAIEGGQRSMQRAISLAHAEMQSGLATLGTIASSAPFIGLLGTVAGLVNAFRQTAMQADAARALMAEALSEALWTAAMGLAVAIPAVWSYNLFRDWLSVLKMEMQNTSSELVGYLWRWPIGPGSFTDDERETVILGSSGQNGTQEWEIATDSHIMLLLLLWPSWLYFIYALARGVYGSMSYR